jgi:hypothetical protein
MSRIGRKVVVMDHTPVPGGYEPPSLTLLGSVHALTQDQNKDYGGSDGFLFLGVPIMNVSP